MNELIHYGMPKRSGRYPWGSGDRPFQSSGGKPSSSAPKKKSNRQLKKQQKAAAKEAKRQQEEAEAKRKLAADKERVLREGSATEVLRYRGQLTNQELEKVSKRLELEKKVSDMSKKELDAAFDKMDSIMNKAKKVNNWVGTATELWNTFVGFYNVTESGKEKPLKRINKEEGKKK